MNTAARWGFLLGENMSERLITQPPKARMFAIPHEYLAICQRKKEHTITRGERKGEKTTTHKADEAAAALLYFFERWTIWRMKEHDYIDGSDVWLYFTLDQIQDYEFGGAFGDHRLKSGIDLLLELGFIQRRNNPNKGYDRTYQYHFVKDVIQEAVNNLAPFFNIEEWKLRKQRMQSLKSKNAISNIEEAIPHDPEHDPTKTETKIAPDGAKGEKPVQPHIALVDAYWAGIPGGKPVRDTYQRHVKVAVALSEAGIRPDEVTQFLVAVYDPATDKFDYKKWHDKPITFEAVADMIPIWKAANTPPPPREEVDFGTKAEWEARRDAYHETPEYFEAVNEILVQEGHDATAGTR
jgi:hypothetical protein